MFKKLHQHYNNFYIEIISLIIAERKIVYIRKSASSVIISAYFNTYTLFYVKCLRSDGLISKEATTCTYSVKNTPVMRTSRKNYEE
ncbi:hypothetical protein KN1_08920 [Stygiolobus caldivivus]|uniref:Uncharacterized protein n=1 Tax=Stygiolobus caldivivus TaxID=2824673 RepID=A0A8D5U501_9CREN|nr:hypothetical protein KN1_08920 [Stygiolobus caldivivus]